MIVKIPSPGHIAPNNLVAVRCPACGKLGTFDSFGVPDIHNSAGVRVGIRRCPDAACRAVLFFVEQNGHIVDTYPKVCIDFDKDRIPPPILSAFEEAVACHSIGCYVASAMMVRKTLEVLCEDRGATGNNLKERVSALRDRIVIPQELIDGADHLRLLGNDAAHIEAQTFNDVGKEEVEVAIEFAKELLKAVYQYSALVERMKALKRSQ